MEDGSTHENKYNKIKHETPETQQTKQINNGRWKLEAKMKTNKTNQTMKQRER